MKIVMDMETRSDRDLIKYGVHYYAESEHTDILCISLKADGGVPTNYITPNFKKFAGGNMSEAVFKEAVKNADEIHAHNVQFERIMWTEIMVKRYSFDEIPMHKWRDTAAKAAMYALPRDLARVCMALGLDVKKDMEGRKVMLRMCKPRAAKTKKKRKPNGGWDVTYLEPKNGIYWHESPEDFTKLLAYCDQDVNAEYAVDCALPDMPQSEIDVWRLDQLINDRGIHADINEINNVMAKVAYKEKKYLKEIAEITGGVIKSVRQTAATITWLESKGVGISNIQKETVIEVLKRDDIPDDVRRLLEIRQSLSKSSVSKYKAMAGSMTDDGGMKGTMMYHGANTGRFAGKRIQPHNFPRDCFKSDAVDFYLNSGVDAFEAEHGCVVLAASKCLRGVLKAEPENELFCADYNAIEARGLAWLAGEQHVLEAFRKGLDLYKVAAATIYGKKYEHITAQERQVGKVAVLALGYQGWIPAFRQMARTYGVTYPAELRKELVEAVLDKADKLLKSKGKKRPEEVKDAVRIIKGMPNDDDLFAEWARPIIMNWRKAHKNITDFWKGLDYAACQSVKTGKAFAYNTIKFGVRNNFLHCRLPNGRLLSYYDPKVKTVTDKYDRVKDSVSFMGINSYTNQWERMYTYGGKLAENVTQAVARDIMCDGMKNSEAAGFPTIFHVHDEIVAELPANTTKTLKEFEDLISIVPEWAKGLPLNAEGWRGVRYRK